MQLQTFANSLVYVPDGKLSDMIVNNYGLRVFRRFNTKISITYDTPVPLVEKVLLSVIGLARSLGVRFAFPNQTMHVEEFPGTASDTPPYDTDPKVLAQRLEGFSAGLYKRG